VTQWGRAIRLEIHLFPINLLSSVRFMTNSQAIAANSEPIRRLATGKAESPSRPFDPGSFLILVVDDVSQNVRLSIEMLDQAGYETTFAMTGAEALMRVQSAQPDLILLDLMMPGMSGLQLCDRLKDDPTLRDIPVLFVTASNEETHMLEAFQLGAVDYITKPFRSAELLARVRVHLELKQARDRLSPTAKRLHRIGPLGHHRPPDRFGQSSALDDPGQKGISAQLSLPTSPFGVDVGFGSLQGRERYLWPCRGRFGLGHGHPSRQQHFANSGLSGALWG
jgi:CheY-like chemotaxis protein